MIATAGECGSVFALNLGHSAQLHPLVGQVEVGLAACFALHVY